MLKAFKNLITKEVILFYNKNNTQILILKPSEYLYVFIIIY